MKVAIFSKSMPIRQDVYSLTRVDNKDLALLDGLFDDQAAAHLAVLSGAISPRTKTFDSAQDEDGNLVIYKGNVPVCICVPETSVKFHNRLILAYKAAK